MTPPITPPAGLRALGVHPAHERRPSAGLGLVLPVPPALAGPGRWRAGLHLPGHQDLRRHPAPTECGRRLPRPGVHALRHAVQHRASSPLRCSPPCCCRTPAIRPPWSSPSAWSTRRPRSATSASTAAGSWRPAAAEPEPEPRSGRPSDVGRTRGISRRRSSPPTPAERRPRGRARAGRARAAAPAGTGRPARRAAPAGRPARP